MPPGVTTLIDAASAVKSQIDSQFREMPGLRLTSAQAARLFGIPLADCERVLAELVSAGAIVRRADGRYVSGWQA